MVFPNREGRNMFKKLIVVVFLFALIAGSLPAIASAQGPAPEPPVFAGEFNVSAAQEEGLSGGSSFPPSAWSSSNLVTMKFLGGRWWTIETNVAGAAIIQIRGKGSRWSELYWTYWMNDGIAHFQLPEDIILPSEGQLGVLTDQYAVLWHGNYSFARGPQSIWPFSMQTWGNGLMLVGSTVEDEVNPERFTVWSYGERGATRQMFGEFGAIGLSSDLMHLPWGADRWQPYGEGEFYNAGWHMRYPDAPVWEEPVPTPAPAPEPISDPIFSPIEKGRHPVPGLIG